MIMTSSSPNSHHILLTPRSKWFKSSHWASLSDMSKTLLTFMFLSAIIAVESRRGGRSSSSNYGHRDNVQAVWQTADRRPGLNPATHRVDASNTVIHRSRYGQTGAGGWEIDHIRPQSKGGSDNIRNLQALNTHDNRSFGNRIKGKPNRHSHWVAQTRAYPSIPHSEMFVRRSKIFVWGAWNPQTKILESNISETDPRRCGKLINEYIILPSMHETSLMGLPKPAWVSLGNVASHIDRDVSSVWKCTLLCFVSPSLQCCYKEKRLIARMHHVCCVL